jgi:eukaryotic-like serine/threonine-protein kinase
MQAIVGKTKGERDVDIPGYHTHMLLGTGQTSFVYLATDPKGREVALKLPKPGLVNDPLLSRMFYTEVSLSKMLKHEHIVPYFEGVPAGDGAFLSMRYFKEGQVQVRDNAPLLEVTQLLADIASALEYAHSKKVIHQDVKPSNVFVSDGRAYLADFGSASSEALGGEVAGSPFYMAPELYTSDKSSPKADVYSFAIMAYELYTAKRPIVGADLEELQRAHLLSMPSPVRGSRRDLPRQLSTLIDRALAKQPAIRPNMSELRAALFDIAGRNDGQAIAAEEPPPAPTDNGPKVGRATGAAQPVTAQAMRMKEEKRGFWDKLLGRNK